MCWRDGMGETTQIGYVNPNNQKCLGTRGTMGSTRYARSYKMECLHCHHKYGANGGDVHERKCPECQNGVPGIPF